MTRRGDEILRIWFEELWNKGRIELFSEYAAPDCLFNTVGPNSEKLVGYNGFRQLYDTINGALSNIHFTVNDTIGAGDIAAVRWSCTAVHSGAGLGIAPTGKPVSLSGMAFIRLKDGKIVEAWDEWDRQGLMYQVGGAMSLIQSAA